VKPNEMMLKRHTHMRAIHLTRQPEMPEVPLALVIELLSAAIASGASIPRALTAVGESLDSETGDALARVGRALLLGASWREAWHGTSDALDVLSKTLRYAWEFGAPCADALHAAREAAEREELTAAKERAQKLGVHLVVPLGLCFLPSFIVLSIIPLVVTLAGSWF
jgi:pilus assembly protein TadC